MSDDTSYEAFLNKANTHTTNSATTQPDDQDKTELYLSSETDEPWIAFSCTGVALQAAEEIAALFGDVGDASFVTSDDDPQYGRVIEPVQQMSSGPSSSTVKFLEIAHGTRIAVYAYVYDGSKKRYMGLKSKKVET